MKNNSVNKEWLYNMCWDWLEDRDPRQVVGTNELCSFLFSNSTIKDSVKNAYFSDLLRMGLFVKSDGAIGRANYWHKDTLQKFKEKIDKEILQRKENEGKVIVFLTEFEYKRQTIMKKIQSFDEQKQCVDYFKSVVLEQLLDEISQAPTEDVEDMIITEISNIWKICRKK